MKLFGKYHFHYVDVFVIIVVLAILGSMLWLRVSRKTQWVTLRLAVTNDEWWWEGSPPQWWYVDSLTPGQTSKNSLGETVAEIVDVQSFDVGTYKRRAFIDIKVRGSFDGRRQVYLFNFQPLQIGKPLELLFGKHNIHGLVTYIDALPDTYTTHTIEVKLSAVHPWVAKSYAPGLEMKDTRGRALAKILSSSSSTSIVNQVTEIGENVEKTFPGKEYVDVVLQVQLKTFQSDGVSYFVDRAAIKVGERITFQFPQSIAKEGEITRIID